METEKEIEVEICLPKCSNLLKDSVYHIYINKPMLLMRENS